MSRRFRANKVYDDFEIDVVLSHTKARDTLGFSLKKEFKTEMAGLTRKQLQYALFVMSNFHANAALMLQKVTGRVLCAVESDHYLGDIINMMDSNQHDFTFVTDIDGRRVDFKELAQRLAKGYPPPS